MCGGKKARRYHGRERNCVYMWKRGFTMRRSVHTTATGIAKRAANPATIATTPAAERSPESEAIRKIVKVPMVRPGYIRSETAYEREGK